MCKISTNPVKPRAEKTLLCQGLPGAGKTVMASLVINHLRCSAPEKAVVIFAYYDAGKREQQKVVHILASLLRQLVEASPSMPGCVQRLHSENQGRQLSSVSVREFTDVLIDAARLFSRVYVAIDALDESEDISNLLSEVFRMQQAVKANVFATSRPNKRIEARFDQPLSLEIRASDEDVSLYLENRIAQHQIIKDENEEYTKATKSTLREAVKKRIREVSDGIFLLARFQMDSVLEMTTPNGMTDIISISSQGQDAYREIYLKTTQRIDNQSSGYRSLAKMTLTWLVCVVRPITISELREALAIKINASRLDNDDFSSTESIVEACKGLVTIGKDSVIQLLHHTAREYLGSNFGWLGEPGIRGLAVAEAAERAKAMAHRDITLKLLTYLSFDIFESGPCFDRFQYLNRKKSNRLYSYGSCYWGDHLKSSGPYISDIVDLDTSSLLTRLLGSEKKWASCIEPLYHRYSFSTLGFRGYQDPFTRLHLAAFCGVKPLVTALLGSHQVNARDISGRASLSYAAEKGHVDVVMSLLKAGAHVDTVDADAKTPLAHAARSGHEEVVRCLVEEKADIEKKCTFNWTPLALAVMDGHRTVAELLLEEGADIQARDSLNRTPLALAAKNGQSSAVEYLLQKNANAEARDDDDQTPLLQATRGGHIAAARVLLDWGVDIEARDCGQSTALINAARAGHVSLVKTLLEKGCDVEARTRHGMTALSYAVLTDHEKTKSLRSRNYDSDINELGGAEAEENFEMCQLLLDNKASPNGTGAADWSPLMEAVSLRRADITRFLLRAGADPNLGSPIILAAHQDYVDIVRALTIAGANTEPLGIKTREFIDSAGKS